MTSADKKLKTILLAFHSTEDREYFCGLLASDEYRVICAENSLSFMESLERYRVDLVIAESDFPGVSMPQLLSFLRNRYCEIKVIIAMKEYSTESELLLRQYKILYVMRWPVNREVLCSVVMRGLKIYERVVVPA